MSSARDAASFEAHEIVREQRFQEVWTRDLDHVFADVATYYDRANHVASLGLWDWFLRSFLAGVRLAPGERVLDVCAGTNAVGIALLKREPRLEVYAIDRSAEMQEVGRQNAEALGFHIQGGIGDAHVLPYPDNHFDVVTLQFASRHLRIKQAFQEIQRVLKPGGRFHHCDMLRPSNPLISCLYYRFLHLTVGLTSTLFGSSPEARRCSRYFVDTLDLFYTAQGLSAVLRGLGFRDIRQRSLLGGVIGFHDARKAPLPRARPKI